ncbi:hypothetical protein Patl1_18559 [Pistacia atlantica]|uniref:Uncharacterized protein n=1 Tax=Pistacia atlantica TaxID=434234 RepID=A0ACC1C263_9ROSI|nr:hypothetical protein Patl1_18559 [Pistacia atlantica]
MPRSKSRILVILSIFLALKWLAQQRELRYVNVNMPLIS